MSLTEQRRAWHLSAEGREVRDEALAIEEPLEIRLAGDPLAVTMRTPGHDHELVAGFLLAEGVINSRADLGSISHCGRPGEEGYGNVIDVAPGPGVVLEEPELDARHRRRGTLTSSSCGVCGRRSIEDLLAACEQHPRAFDVTQSALTGITEKLAERQPGFARSGGLHAAAIANPEGELLHTREDIGRHNAVDKVVGRLVIDGQVPATERVLVVSGRVSFEIVQKAVVAGISCVVGVSAPSSLAVQTAERAGVVLVAFARGDAMNVYSLPERITRR